MYPIYPWLQNNYLIQQQQQQQQQHYVGSKKSDAPYPLNMKLKDIVKQASTNGKLPS